MNVTGPLIVSDCDPEIDLAPDQLPEAVQLDASTDDQLNVIVLPRLTFAGLAVRLTVGAVTTGGVLTVTVTLLVSLPPSPLQVML